MRSTTAALVVTQVDELAALRGEVLALRARVETLERGRGPRATADRALLMQLPISTQELPFRAAELFAHARRADPALAAAIDAALLETEGELACWLRRMRGMAHGVTLDRLPRRRWRAYTSTHDVYVPLSAPR